MTKCNRCHENEAQVCSSCLGEDAEITVRYQMRQTDEISRLKEVCEVVVASYIPDKQAFDVLAMRYALDRARAALSDLG